MPNFRGVTVNVVTQDDQPFGEYGVKYMPNLNECSCYIQSSTDLSFKVQLKENTPFLWEVDEDEDDVAARASQRGAPSQLASRFAQSASGTGRVLVRQNTRAQAETSSPLPPRMLGRVSSSTPPFHLLVCVYLDGRAKPERRTILYLNPEHRYHKMKPTQLVSRWVQDSTGDIRSHRWVFKDVVSIETMLDKILLSGDFPRQGTLDSKQSDDLVAAMTAATLKSEERKKPDPSVGSIRVTLERISIGDTKEDRYYRTSHKSWDKDDVKMGNAEGHVAGPSEKGELVSGLRNEPVKIIEYLPYLTGEGLYAQYTFYYRSKDTLRKFDFPEFARERKEKSKGASRRYLDEKLASLTPLSISNPLKSSPVSIKKPENRKGKRGIAVDILSGSSSPHAKSKVSKCATTIGASEAKQLPAQSPHKGRNYPGRRGTRETALPSDLEVYENDSKSDIDSDSETERVDHSNRRMEMDTIFASKESKVDTIAYQSTPDRVAKPTATFKIQSAGLNYSPSSDADVDEEEARDDSDGVKAPRSAFYVDKRPPELRDDYDPMRTEYHGVAENKPDHGLSDQLVGVALGKKRILDDSGSDSDDADGRRTMAKRARGSSSPRDKESDSHQMLSGKVKPKPLFPPPASNPKLATSMFSLADTAQWSMSDLSGYNGDTEREVETDKQPDHEETSENSTEQTMAMALGGSVGLGE